MNVLTATSDWVILPPHTKYEPINIVRKRMLRRQSQNPIRRYWFHRLEAFHSDNVEAPVLHKHTMQQETRVISPINGSKSDSKLVQKHTNNIIHIRQPGYICTYMHVYAYHVVSTPVFLFLSRCVPGVCFPFPLPFVFRKPTGLTFIGSKTLLAVRSPRAVGCSKVKMSETPRIISRKFLCSMEGAIGL